MLEYTAKITQYRPELLESLKRGVCEFVYFRLATLELQVYELIFMTEAMKKSNKKTIKIENMRSSCPISNALDILGDKWTLLIIRDAFAGKKTYSEFQSSPESIPTNILAERLKRLVTHDILRKIPYQQHPVRFCYELTEKGHALNPILKEVVKWGETYIIGVESKIKIQFN